MIIAIIKHFFWVTVGTKKDLQCNYPPNLVLIRLTTLIFMILGISYKLLVIVCYRIVLVVCVINYSQSVFILSLMCKTHSFRMWSFGHQLITIIVLASNNYWSFQMFLTECSNTYNQRGVNKQVDKRVTSYFIHYKVCQNAGHHQ